MLQRHLQNLGRSWVAHAEHQESLYMNKHIFRYPWFSGPYNWAAYPPQLNWISHTLFGPSNTPFQRPPSLPGQATQAAWFHFSNFNMASNGDEPAPKRVKSSSTEDRSGRKPSPNSSYSQTKDFTVPTLYDSQVSFPPTYPVTSTYFDGGVNRRWEDFSQFYAERCEGEKRHLRTTEHFDFTVMSYNILSQDLLEDNFYLYSHCRRPLLFWSYRLPNILKELKEMGADILCLQEVQEDHYRTQIKPSLEALGYHCEYKTRTGTKPDGCAICFRSSMFDLVMVKPVEYYRPDIALLDRDNIALVLLLRPKGQQDLSYICVANTHLLFNPKRGDIKLTQLAILLAEIGGVALLKDKQFCPIVLCGDFNSVPGSPLYRFIKEGMLNYKGMTIGKVSGQEKYPRGQRTLTRPIWPKRLGISQSCTFEPTEGSEKTGESLKEETLKEESIENETSENLKEESTEKETSETLIPNRKTESSLQHHFSLSSVYSHFFPETGVPEITTSHSRTALTVDYIFYSAARNDIFAQSGADVSCGGLHLLGRLSLLTEQDLWSINGLPNENNSSDHLSLLAKFRLVK
ncbi:protein angel homolog 2 [Bombina bombina]|uniref:protein angel homolog 2 n=1 Tax=Bombina bombina TaxID=8345 RepID=UPI00235B01C1|nr:protein angel homolog 2 [Bombina bombina]